MQYISGEASVRNFTGRVVAAQDIKVLVCPVKGLNAARSLFTVYLGAEPYADRRIMLAIEAR